MNQRILEKIMLLGLEEREARVYLSALEFGPTTIQKLSQKSGIKRTTIYEFVDSMVSRGLITTSASGKRTLYGAPGIEGLERMIEKQRELVSELSPIIELLTKKSPTRPRIRFYEGIEGLKSVYGDTLEIPEGSEVLLYGSFAGTYANMTDTFLKQYVRKRISKKIFVRALLSAEEHTALHAKQDKKELRETILLSPKDFPVFQNEIVIYGNKIAMISYGDEKIGIIIESAHIADTQRAMFNGFWKLLKASKKK